MSNSLSEVALVTEVDQLKVQLILRWLVPVTTHQSTQNFDISSIDSHFIFENIKLNISLDFKLRRTKRDYISQRDICRRFNSLQTRVVSALTKRRVYTL